MKKPVLFLLAFSVVLTACGESSESDSKPDKEVLFGESTGASFCIVMGNPDISDEEYEALGEANPAYQALLEHYPEFETMPGNQIDEYIANLPAEEQDQLVEATFSYMEENCPTVVESLGIDVQVLKEIITLELP